MSDTGYYLSMAFCVAIVAVAIVAKLRSYNVDEFRRTAQTGDMCEFFIGEDRHFGQITAYDNDQVVVDTPFGSHITYRSNIYPA